MYFVLFLNSIYLLRLCCCGVLCLRFIHLIWDVFSGNILQISILLNIIRQSFAFALLLVSFSAMNIEELRKRDFFKCMLVIVVCAILFHSVMYALLVVPFVALYMKKWNISKRFLFFMLAMSFLAFYFNVAVNYVMGFVDQTGLEGKLINYAIRNAQIGEDSGYSILKVTFVSVWAAFLIKMCPVKTDLFLFMKYLMCLVSYIWHGYGL